MRVSHAILRTSGLAALVLAGPALADDAAPAAQAAAFWDTFSLVAEVEAGVAADPNNSGAGNFGQLFTDKENDVLLNQLSLSAARPIDPKAADFDWGFRFEGMYGSDARYTHFLGELDTAIKERTQLDVVEASISTHWPLPFLPWLDDSSVDVKAGQYPTPLGSESIEPSANPFYSHSYIFSFGLPFKHTGGYATWHVTPDFDFYFGGDTGENTSFGKGDDNTTGAVIGGFGFNNLADGNLTVLTLLHFGPEDPSSAFNHVDHTHRYESDLVATYKASDALTFTTEGNFIRDDGFRAEAWGVAQYVSYTLNDLFVLNARGEVYHDQGQNGTGFFVAAFPGNEDFVNAQYGRPNGSYNSGRATYSEWTLGTTIKPPVPDVISGFMIRPEVRFNSTLDGVKAYNGSDTQFTYAVDLVLPFAIVAAATPAAPAPPAPPPAVAPPAPPAPAPEAQRSFEVFFDFDKSDITEAGANVIQAAADTVRAGNVARLSVTGHTDTVGTAAYNQKLSERRAAAVKRQLVADGVAGGEITTVGAGKTGLLVPTADGVREPQNRRAEILVQ